MSTASKLRVTWVVRSVGAALFVASYFLPAAGTRDHTSEFAGYQCAYLGAAMGLTPISSHNEVLTSSTLLTSMAIAISDLLNLMIPVYLIVRGRWKGYVALLVLACSADTFLALHVLKLQPRIGCYLWILGALILMSPEAASARRRTDAEFKG
jgi:hypothetical protein